MVEIIQQEHIIINLLPGYSWDVVTTFHFRLIDLQVDGYNEYFKCFFNILLQKVLYVLFTETQIIPLIICLTPWFYDLFHLFSDSFLWVINYLFFYFLTFKFWFVINFPSFSCFYSFFSFFFFFFLIFWFIFILDFSFFKPISSSYHRIIWFKEMFIIIWFTAWILILI